MAGIPYYTYIGKLGDDPYANVYHCVEYLDENKTGMGDHLSYYFDLLKFRFSYIGVLGTQIFCSFITNTYSGNITVEEKDLVCAVNGKPIIIGKSDDPTIGPFLTYQKLLEGA